MQQVCVHPFLAIGDKHEQYAEACKAFGQPNLNLHDVQHSGKLVALSHLLVECGLGTLSMLYQTVCNRYSE